MKRGYLGRGMLSFLLAATAGVFSPGRLDFRNQIDKPAAGFKAPFAKSSGRQWSGQKAERDRLILDRSSSVRKAQRWLNNGTLIAGDPSDRAITRHKVRRVERQRAENLAKLAAGA